ncbi:MAG: DUF1501 domain-containing protein, partial [Planctomycetales bacterium]|nr:DUF1501 domain-containing protein [Planctomycetales bacterium]
MAFVYRRNWMKAAAAGIGGVSLSGWLPALADQVATDPARRRHCILLWMSGGPSQTDTFDMKPGHENGGEFKEVSTNVPGVRFCEHLPKLAMHADKLAIVRSLSTKEGDHARGTHLMRTGQRPMGATQYPSMTCALAKELGDADAALPHCVSIAPYQALSRDAFGPGFLGPKYAPLVVNAQNAAAFAAPGGQPADSQQFTKLTIEALQPAAGVTDARTTRRRELWRQLQQEFVKNHAGAANAQNTVYDRSISMMNSAAAEAFDLSKEPDALRTAYGRGVFGQGCLMAR